MRLALPEFAVIRHKKVARLSALCTGRLYPRDKIPGTHFSQRLSRPQGHIAARKIKSMKSLKDPIENRTRYLPACSAMPQPAALPRSETNVGGSVTLGSFSDWSRAVSQFYWAEKVNKVIEVVVSCLATLGFMTISSVWPKFVNQLKYVCVFVYGKLKVRQRNVVWGFISDAG